MGVSKAIEVPINVVGSSVFGISPKISVERTYNMFISDDWLISAPGFQKLVEFASNGEGRGIFFSARQNFAMVVISAAVYIMYQGGAISPVGTLDTSFGEVSIDENLVGQIAICDGQNLYIFNEANNTLTKQTLLDGSNPIVPGYVIYHNSFFLVASSLSSLNAFQWYVYTGTGNSVTLLTKYPIQSKPDNAIAVQRLPGKGNNILVFGTTITEVWTQVEGPTPYRKVQSFNIDFGCASPSTIASSDQYVAWLGINENNSPVILATDGANTRKISTDGIDNLMKTIQFPAQSTADFYQQEGHLFYQLTFFNPEDNLTLAYDFSNDKFFDLTDEKMNYHPARKSIYFNEKLIFVSLNDAAIYQTGTEFVSYNYSLDPNAQGEIIPRIRNCKSVRKTDTSRFRAEQFTFWLEQGVNKFYGINADIADCFGELITEAALGEVPIITEDSLYFMLAEDGFCQINLERPVVDLAISVNGGQSFSSWVRRNINPSGDFRNQIRWNRMGQANEMILQLRFLGLQRFVCQQGTLSII